MNLRRAPVGLALVVLPAAVALLELGAADARQGRARARTADDILDDSARAAGGVRAFHNRTLYSRGRLTIEYLSPAGGINYALWEHWESNRGERHLVMGASFGWEQGCNRGDCWHADAMGIKTYKRTPALSDLTYPRAKSLFPVRRIVPVPTGAPAGLSLECVELQHPEANPRVVCFETSTHVYRYYETRNTNGPNTWGQCLEHRWVAGMRICTHLRYLHGTTISTMQVRELKADVPMPPQLFSPPRKPTLVER